MKKYSILIHSILNFLLLCIMYSYNIIWVLQTTVNFIIWFAYANFWFLYFDFFNNNIILNLLVYTNPIITFIIIYSYTKYFWKIRLYIPYLITITIWLIWFCLWLVYMSY